MIYENNSSEKQKEYDQTGLIFKPQGEGRNAQTLWADEQHQGALVLQDARKQIKHHGVCIQQRAKAMEHNIMQTRNEKNIAGEKIKAKKTPKTKQRTATGKSSENIEHVPVFSIQRCYAVQVESEHRCPFSLCLEAACHLDSPVIKIWKHFWSEMNGVHKLHLTLSCNDEKNGSRLPLLHSFMVMAPLCPGMTLF